MPDFKKGTLFIFAIFYGKYMFCVSIAMKFDLLFK